MKSFPPGLVLGFMVGAVLGLAWGQKAKSNISQAVSVSSEGARVHVTVDGLQMIKAGLPSLLK